MSVIGRGVCSAPQWHFARVFGANEEVCPASHGFTSYLQSSQLVRFVQKFRVMVTHLSTQV